MNVRLVERHKTCTRCGQDKTWSAYYAGKKWDDGTMRLPQSRCKDCMAQIMRERRPRNSAEREWHRAWQRRAYRRWRQDPEWVGLRREQDRMATRRRKGIPPERWRVTGLAAKSPTVDAAPFAAWLSSSLAAKGMSYADAAGVIGTGTELLRKHGTGLTERVSLDLVDRALIALAGPRLDDLYGQEAA